MVDFQHHLSSRLSLPFLKIKSTHSGAKLLSRKTKYLASKLQFLGQNVTNSLLLYKKIKIQTHHPKRNVVRNSWLTFQVLLPMPHLDTIVCCTFQPPRIRQYILIRHWTVVDWYRHVFLIVFHLRMLHCILSIGPTQSTRRPLETKGTKTFNLFVSRNRYFVDSFTEGSFMPSIPSFLPGHACLLHC